MPGFKLRAPFQPTGDQPQAIQKLTAGIKTKLHHQVLLGVTGSGKTFTMANVIAQVNRPTLVISHNKTLAAQLFQEYREFFPQNAVEYFVSYYDYYQPEAYIPQTDTYIEKDAAINERIDKMRLSATTSLMTRSDCIVVASVSCIYGLGSPQQYLQSALEIRKGMRQYREKLINHLVRLFYDRNDYDFKRGTFRVRGGVVDVFPAYLDYGIRIEISNQKISSIKQFEPVSGNIQGLSLDHFILFPSKHFITDKAVRESAMIKIRGDLEKRVQELRKKGKNLEAHRLEQKTNYDLELINEIGYCKGIENYSRYFDNRAAGDPPHTLLDFFNYQSSSPWLLIIDESHMSIPQMRGMYKGDQSRKRTLIEHGFRLPSALDNRPLKFEEFLTRTHQIIYTSATPGEWEMRQALLTTSSKVSYAGVVEQLVRPTGLLDPEIEVRGAKNQVENLLWEIKKRIKRKERVLVTTLTKRMAEDLSEYLAEQEIKVHYLHADVNTFERTDILEDLRRGGYQVVVGINLLREGLDLPEVSLVAILDADKEGFLRSEVALIQTMGRAARHEHGKVILYADKITGSIRRAVDEVNRRRKVQKDYNQKHDISPTSIKKPIREKLAAVSPETKIQPKFLDFEKMSKSVPNRKKLLHLLEDEMKEAANNLEFEKAAYLRDKITDLKQLL